MNRTIFMDFRIMVHLDEEKSSAEIERARELCEGIEAVIKEYDSTSYIVREIRFE